MKNLRLVLALVSLAFSSFALHAAALSWDPGASSGASLGGSGNWDQVSSLWYDSVADVPWTNALDSDAVFTGASGTVTLVTNIVAADIYFTNVTGSMLITNETTADTLTVLGTVDTGGGEHSIGAPLVNSSTLTKSGVGRLDLTVDNSAGLTGSLVINQGSIAVDTDNAVGQYTSITVSNGAALVLNGGTNDLPAFYPNVTISGTGITNSGSLRNLSGVTTFYGQIILATNNSVIYVDSGSALVYDGENGPITDNGANYNLIISGSGTGNFDMGAINIGGSLIVEGPASCYNYLNGITPTVWKSTYISPGATLYAENTNSFGIPPAALTTTNVLLDGGTIVSGGTYSMYANDGITVTTNGGTLTDNSGTWTTCNIYSLANTPVTLNCIGSMRPGGANSSAGVINLGMGTLIKSGSGDCNLGYAQPATEIYSNIVVNGSGSLTFNYDSTGGTTSLGAVPSSLNVSNIFLNGGSLHVGHSTTIGATRGIYVTTAGGTIEDVVSSGGTVTINSPISGPGSVNFPNGHSGTVSAIILAANNTYAGTTTAGASCNVTVGAGSTSGTLGTGNTTDSSSLTFNRTGSYSYGGVISGTGSIVKNASGTVTLTGNNTYSGNTTNNAGTLLVNNTAGSGTGSGTVLVVSGATLGGSGAIAGAVTVNSGGTLALGSSTLTLNGGLSLAGNITVQINKALTPSNGMAMVSGTLANSGTGSVKIVNAGVRLVPGDTFQLFSEPVSGGATLTISGGGAVWNNNLAGNGSISVVSVPTPGLNAGSPNGTNVVITATNGVPSGTYVLLSSTNLLLPLASWKTVSTNSYNSSGNVSITNTISPGVPQQFYRLEDQ